MIKAYRLEYFSTLGWRVIKKKMDRPASVQGEARGQEEQNEWQRVCRGTPPMKNAQPTRTPLRPQAWAY